MLVGKEFGRMLKDAGERLGREFSGGLEEVQLYASERMLHLSFIVDEPGYGEALIAERDSVALKAGIALVDAADAADMELIGMIGGALAIGARALAGA